MAWGGKGGICDGERVLGIVAEEDREREVRNRPE